MGITLISSEVVVPDQPFLFPAPSARRSSPFADSLARSQLIDCNGRVTHTLTLLPDGTVEVVAGAVRAIIDPSRKVVLRPAGVRFGDQVMSHAATLAAEGLW